MYNKKQLEVITADLQCRIVKGTAKPYEIVIMLVVMEKAGKITVESIKDVLLDVLGNKVAVLKALNKALPLIDDKMIEDIVREVEMR